VLLPAIQPCRDINEGLNTKTIASKMFCLADLMPSLTIGLNHYSGVLQQEEHEQRHFAAF
jgi:hypothetical protein